MENNEEIAELSKFLVRTIKKIIDKGDHPEESIIITYMSLLSCALARIDEDIESRYLKLFTSNQKEIRRLLQEIELKDDDGK